MFTRPQQFRVQDAVSNCKADAMGIDEQTIKSLDVDALRLLAPMYQNLVRKIATRIAELDERTAMQKRTAVRFELLQTIPAMVADFIDQGFSLDAAMRQTSQRMAGCPLETISVYWSDWLRSRDQQIKSARTILVMRLASRGLHNAEISERTGIPDYTVSRIISKALGKRYMDGRP